MTPDDLLAHCQKQAQLGSSVVTFVLPRNGRGEYRQLAGRGTPRGRIVDQRPGRDVVLFQRADVEAWLATVVDPGAAGGNP